MSDLDKKLVNDFWTGVSEGAPCKEYDQLVVSEIPRKLYERFALVAAVGGRRPDTLLADFVAAFPLASSASQTTENETSTIVIESPGKYLQDFSKAAASNGLTPQEQIIEIMEIFTAIHDNVTDQSHIEIFSEERVPQVSRDGITI